MSRCNRDGLFPNWSVAVAASVSHADWRRVRLYLNVHLLSSTGSQGNRKREREKEAVQHYPRMLIEDEQPQIHNRSFTLVSSRSTTYLRSARSFSRAATRMRRLSASSYKHNIEIGLQIRNKIKWPSNRDSKY